MGIHGRFEGVEPFVDIVLNGATGPVKVLVDTGFTEGLMLPRKLVAELGLPKVGQGFYVTASGDEPETVVHEVQLQWLGRTKEVIVLNNRRKHRAPRHGAALRLLPRDGALAGRAPDRPMTAPGPRANALSRSSRTRVCRGRRA